MGFWDTAKRVGVAVGTGGLSETWNPQNYKDAYSYATGGKKLSDLTNDLGLTNPPPPDLSQGPDAQRIRTFADQLNSEYRDLSPGASDIRGNQLDILGQLDKAARGETPSQAEILQRKGFDEAMMGQLGLASTLQGANPGAAMRAGLSGAANMTGRAALESSALRAKEIADAQRALAEAAAAYRNEDISQQDVNNRMRLGLGNLTSTTLLAPYNAAIANQQLQLQNQAANQNTIGGLVRTAGLASDERVKENVSASPEMADAFLAGLKPKTFDYKDPSAPGQYPGHQLGVLAQDMNGGVTTGPDGKKWISADVIGRILAGMGRLNEKVEGQG